MEPGRGLRCNPHKLLLDPYAKAVDGDVEWHPAVYGYELDDPSRMSEADSAPYVPKGVVVNPYFDWGNDQPPRIPYHRSVIYEAHVKGLTQRHPAVPSPWTCNQNSATGSPSGNVMVSDLRISK